MPISIPLREALAKLSDSDRASYKRDIQLLGKGMLRQDKDGGIRYIPPAQWPNVHHFGGWTTH